MKRQTKTFMGSERETVTPPDGMGVFDFEESGYTRQDERG
jgi:hypothetical protein